MGELAHLPEVETEFDDGDDGGTEIEGINIEPVDNGYIINITIDGGDAKLIAPDKEAVIKIIEEWL